MQIYFKGGVATLTAKSCSTDWKVLGFVFVQSLEEAVDSRSSCRCSAVVQERYEVADHVEEMSDFGQLVPESGRGEGLHRIHNLRWHDEACRLSVEETLIEAFNCLPSINSGR